MKISIILNNICGVGGVERVVTNLANELFQGYDCQIHIISLFSNPKETENTFYEIDENVKVIHLGHKNFKNIKIVADFLNIGRQNYDHIICCSTLISLLALVANFGKKNNKVYAWEHSQYDHASYKIKFLRRMFYPYLDRIITLTKHDGALFSRYLKKVSVIPNFKSFESPKASSHKNHTMISVGRLGYEKGFDMLIEAYNNINTKIGDWKLEIYGEGKEYNTLKQKILSYRLEDKVFLKPFTPNIIEKYLNSSIFICSSRSESFSMVIIEAMECGLPCVSFNCKIGPKEIISEGIDGFLVEPFDINELSEKIELLINDASKRISMGENAKEKAKQYDVASTMSIWGEVLKLEKL
ncbi:glycosyltransferase family 4 protein [Priestia megaterium]|uniref:glycosyltransferase family 4 protein n=1 Tax=Priestia megaterium TaxID=1404 RepID=UPI002B250CF9|nr:glycosyltransferase family 4 protein [Priestia megaterium]MEB2289969.1 glycosyltransferase family 4 protein [Priestia megaterium]